MCFADQRLYKLAVPSSDPVTNIFISSFMKILVIYLLWSFSCFMLTQGFVEEFGSNEQSKLALRHTITSPDLEPEIIVCSVLSQTKADTVVLWPVSSN